MEKKAPMQRSSPSPRRAGAGGQDEHRIKQFPKKSGGYRNNSGIASFHEKKPRSSSRGSSKNPKKDSTRWQTFPVDTSKALGSHKHGEDIETETPHDLDEELASVGDNKITSRYLNFQYSSSNRHKCGPYGKYRHFPPHYPRQQQAMYNKEAYLQANCQFIVKEDGDYGLHTVDPDKLVDWNMIEQICLSSHENPLCPICLDAPRVARITRCGHVYCWPCIIHYLKLGDKEWRKCPICYEAIIPSDLKSVIAIPSHKFKAGETIEMQLMQRKKGSMLSKPLSVPSASPTIEWKGDMAAIIRNIHAKLLKASSKIVLDKIVSLELKELEEQLKEARSEESGEEAFIEIALQSLKEKEIELTRKIQQPKSVLVKNGPKVPNHQTAKLTKTKQIMDLIQEQVAATSVEDPAFSDDEEQLQIPAGDTEPEQHAEPRSAELSPTAAQNETAGATSRIASMSADYYFYYQAKDGQNIFLQPVNSRCLTHEYGSLQSCPEFITAKIIAIESHTMTQELRKRFRYLSHLPVSCEFTFCELMIRPPVLSRETLSKFANEFYERKMARQRKKREERKLERKIEKSLTMDSFGRILDLEPEATSVDLQSLEDFPSQIGSGSPDGTNASSPVVNVGSWGRSSFANALQRTNVAPIRRKEDFQPKAQSETAKGKTCADEEANLDEDHVPVPSFTSAFSDAVSSALEDQLAGRTWRNHKPKGKNKKGKTLLFTTSNGPKYS